MASANGVFAPLPGNSHMFGLFRSKGNEAQIERLNDAVMEQARQPQFYASLAVKDTLEGRFEMVVLHAFLLVRRLDKEPEPGPEIAKDLTDAVFARFEIALRETGVSDIAVPKRMKKLASGYLGRARAYNDALDAADGLELARALARNVFGEDLPGDDEGLSGDGDQIPSRQAVALANYVRASEHSLARLSLQQVLATELNWPDILEQAA